MPLNRIYSDDIQSYYSAIKTLIVGDYILLRDKLNLARESPSGSIFLSKHQSPTMMKGDAIKIGRSCLEYSKEAGLLFPNDYAIILAGKTEMIIGPNDEVREAFIEEIKEYEKGTGKQSIEPLLQEKLEKKLLYILEKLEWLDKS